jgi:phosphatidylglycerophosphate synthase
MDVVNIFWWLECVLFAAAVAAVIILFPKISDWIFKKNGSTLMIRLVLMIGRFLPPNVLSILHVPIALIGYFYFYLNGDLMACAICLGVSAAMDSLDGQMARLMNEHLKLPKPQGFWTSLFHRGGTELGESIDPAMDKAGLMPIYIHITYGYICYVLTDGMDMAYKICYLCCACFIACTILTDLMGTVIRFDYFKKIGLIRSSKAATIIGKTKTVTQWLWFILYPMQDMKWIENEAFEYSVVLAFFLSCIMVLAIFSLLSKMRALEKHWAKLISTFGG